MTQGTTPEEATPTPPTKAHPSLLREAAIIVVLSLVIATVVRIFLVQAFVIPSGSMENTLQVGDRVAVSKLTMRFGELNRGDVVVFEDPAGWLGASYTERGTGPLEVLREALQFVGVLPSDAQGHLIKRVVGLPGDRVACCDSKGRVTVNGAPLDDADFRYPGDAPSGAPFDEVVPAGRLWVMGDHRSVSGDSRINGFVPVDSVTGRAVAVIWPIPRWETLLRPAAFAGVPDP